jgi:hypothetical protein
MNTRLTFTALFCVIGTSLSGQAPPAAVENPVVQQLVGHWRMVGNVRGKPATYDMVARRILNDRYVEMHMQDIARPSTYEALVFIGEDTLTTRVLVHWLDVFGAAYSVPHGVGTISGDTVQFQIAYPDGPFRDTFVFQRAKREWQFHIEATDGHGGWKPFADYAVSPARQP